MSSTSLRSRATALVLAVLVARARAGIGTDSSVLDGKVFDFVIVGGGAAGLTLANRLSAEDYSVALLEAGNSGEEVMERILIPALTYTDGVSVPGSVNDWGYFTGTLGRGLHQPRGKVLGGSTAVNALYMVRASDIEHDAWASLHPDAPQDWSWDGLFPYMKKSETFTPPTQEVEELASVEFTTDFHGSDGPVHVSFPQFVYEIVQQWVPTLKNLNLKTSDPQGGEGWGGFIATNSINPADGTRSYAKTAYLDPVVDRANLAVLLEHQAVKIIFDTSGDVPRAKGVQFARDANDDVKTVYARREVISSAGVFGTPQLLELSGVGARSILEPLGVEVVADVPGVGEHFQDHVLSPVLWKAREGTVTGENLTQNPDFKQEQIEIFNEGDLAKSQVSAPNNAIGYVSLRQLMGDEAAETFMREIRANMTDVISRMPVPDESVRRGYQLTYETEVDRIIDSDVGVVEILLGSFNWSPDDHTIGVQVAIQHPMSRGTVHLNNTDPFQTPIIVANYLSVDSDWHIMRAGIRWLREQLATTAPFSDLLVEELQPGPAAVDDAAIDAHLYNTAATQYHPASTSSMLPLEFGGVVDTELKVYNVEGLRVVDASVVPIGLCAHLMGPTYAIAEKASDIILDNPAAPRANADQDGESHTTSSGNNDDKSSGSRSVVPLVGSLLSLALGFVAVW